MTSPAPNGNGVPTTTGTSPSAADMAEIAPPKSFSWLDPHPIFVIILVGEDEQPFGIQKDFLCAKSAYYRKYFEEIEKSEMLENIVKLQDTPVEVFAYAQNYLYTGRVFPDLGNMPSYEVLVGVWKLGHKLGIEGLCDQTLEAMVECRRVTEHIPATPLLVQVWKDTPEGSSIRRLLLSWAAEYMRSSESRAEFARSLPQEVLSELVVAMSSLDSPPLPTVAPPAAPITTGPAPPRPAFGPANRKNVHYLEVEGGDEPSVAAKKHRHSDVLPNGSDPLPQPPRTIVLKKPARSSFPAAPAKSAIKRRSNAGATDPNFSTDQKMNFCADLLSRMLSGPGFWTRLVGPFKDPVDPLTDDVPDYFEKIKKPMDLGTMKAKMDRKEYTNEEEFVADMRQIFTNCYTYWTKKHPMWAACEKLEKTFEEKYSQMNKWIAKMDGDESL